MLTASVAGAMPDSRTSTTRVMDTMIGLHPHDYFCIDLHLTSVQERHSEVDRVENASAGGRGHVALWPQAERTAEVLK